MAMRTRPANLGGLAVGVVYLVVAFGVFVVVRAWDDPVLGAPLAVELALAGAIVVYLGWTRPTVRWTDERVRRRRVTVVVLLVLTVLTSVFWAVDVAASRLG